MTKASRREIDVSWVAVNVVFVVLIVFACAWYAVPERGISDKEQCLSVGTRCILVAWQKQVSHAMQEAVERQLEYGRGRPAAGFAGAREICQQTKRAADAALFTRSQFDRTSELVGPSLANPINKCRKFGEPTRKHIRGGRTALPTPYTSPDRAIYGWPGELQAKTRRTLPAGRLIRTSVIELAPPPAITPLPSLAPASRIGQESVEFWALIRNKEFDKALALATHMTQSNPNDPVGYNLKGTAYFGKKDWVNARKSFERAVALRPDDAVALVNLAQVDIQQKDTAAARKRLDAVLSTDGKNVSAMLGLAQLEFIKGDDKAALGWFEKAKVARPEAVDPRLNVAAYYMRRRNFAQAIGELTEATRYNPGNADILDLLGQAQMADGQNESAVVTYTKLVSAHPDAPLAYYQLSAAQIAMNEFPGAVESLKKALQLKPDFVEAAVVLAELEVRANRYAEALTLAKQVQSVQRVSQTGLVLEGDILMAQERYADAARAYEKAVAIGQSGVLIAKLFTAQTRLGNTKQADAILQRWLKDHPDDIGALQFLAAEYMKKGQNKPAIKQYQLVLKKDPKNQLALNNLANLYQQEGDSRALDTAEAAFKLNPESSVIADTLGWMLVEKGNTARGLTLLESAAAREPKNLEIRYHLVAALAKSGDKAKARKELEGLLASGQAFPQREAAQALLNKL
jgi:tetratricopeptide (TPR) repeat protein